jgi:hypothetical protein
MSLRNQGDGGLKMFENHWFKGRTLILNIEMFKKPSGPDDASGEWRIIYHRHLTRSGQGNEIKAQ